MTPGGKCKPTGKAQKAGCFSQKNVDKWCFVLNLTLRVKLNPPVIHRIYTIRKAAIWPIEPALTTIHPGSIPVTPRIYSVNPPGTKGQFSMAKPPNHGSTVVSTAASQRQGPGFNSWLGSLVCVEFAHSPRVCVGFLRVLRFPSTVPKICS